MAGPSIGTWVKVKTKTGFTPRVIPIKDGGGSYSQGQVITQSQFEQARQKRTERLQQKKSSPLSNQSRQMESSGNKDNNEFSHNGDTATIGNARYRKGGYSLIRTPSGDGYKTNYAWLAENLGGKYSGRERGYVMSPSATKKFRQLAPLAGLKSYERTQSEEFMFRREFFNQRRASFKDKSNPYVIENAKYHRMSVESAIKEGKTVPEKVLKDYPDLLNKARR